MLIWCVQAARMFSVVFCYSSFGYKLAASIHCCQFSYIHIKHTYQYTHTCRSGAPYRVLRATYTNANWTFKVSFWHSETYDVYRNDTFWILKCSCLFDRSIFSKRMKMKKFFCAQNQMISESNLNLDHKWMTFKTCKIDFALYSLF